jgi:hypothetical protein
MHAEPAALQTNGDELAERPVELACGGAEDVVRERKREHDSGRGDDSPPVGDMPQDQQQPMLGSRQVRNQGLRRKPLALGLQPLLYRNEQHRPPRGGTDERPTESEHVGVERGGENHAGAEPRSICRQWELQHIAGAQRNATAGLPRELPLLASDTGAEIRIDIEQQDLPRSPRDCATSR